MKLVTAGQWIRFFGLLAELIGIAGVWFVTSRDHEVINGFLGPDPATAFKILIVCGFFLWLIGRMLITVQRARGDRRERRTDNRNIDELRL